MNTFGKVCQNTRKTAQLLFGVNALLIIVLRALETSLLMYHHNFPGALWDSFVGLGFDLVGLAWLTLILMPLLFLFSFINQRAALVAGGGVSVVLQLIHIPIVYFYVSTLMPLDALFLAHSKEEILFTLRTAGINFRAFFVGMLLYVSVFGLLLFLFKKYQPFHFLKYYYLVFTFTAILLAGLVKPGYGQANTFHSPNIQQNKSVHFYADILKSVRYSLFSPFANWERDLVAKRYQELFNHQQYVSLEYPFLNQRNRSNPWGPFFKTGQTPPSIVVLIVEGLGNDFVKPGSEIVFMPFLDSLIKKSLYYDHFLGAGERSYAVLPAVTGSLPHAEKGFTLLPNMPLHLSLFNQLKNQGYHTGFFYGQGAYFHQKDAFLKRNHVDLIIDKTNYPEEFTKIYDPRSDYHWGYHDKDLFRNYFRFRKPAKDGPVLDVFFTGTMHPPFVIDQEYDYQQRFAGLLNTAAMDAEKRKFYENYALYYRTIMFTDDALRSFFQEYKNLPAWDNTIFLITGDHPITEIPIDNELKRYHVPLIVFSPLLKQGETFHNIAGQFEVMPALMNLLEQNYGLQFGDYSHMFGVPCDTSSHFNSNIKMPLMRGNRQIDEIVAGKHFYSGGKLYQILHDFHLQPCVNASVRDSLKEMLDVYNFINDEFVNESKLIPDSVFFQHTGFEYLAGETKALSVSSSDEFTRILELSFSPQKHTDYFAFFSGVIKGSLPSGNAKIVFELRDDNDKVVFWQSSNLNVQQRRSGRYVSAFFNNYITLDALPQDIDHTRFLIYLWNPESIAIEVDPIELKLFAVSS